MNLFSLERREMWECDSTVRSHYVIDLAIDESEEFLVFFLKVIIYFDMDDKIPFYVLFDHSYEDMFHRIKILSMRTDSEGRIWGLQSDEIDVPCFILANCLE